MEKLENEQKDNVQNSFEKKSGLNEWIMIVLCVILLSAAAYISFNIDTLYKNFRNFPKIYQSKTRQTSEDIQDEFAPYMKNLQHKIKQNWNPPKSTTSNSVELLFHIAKDGRLLSYKILKSSGSEETDQAAIDALKQSAPFEELPKSYKNNSITVQFHFDYNVFQNDKLKGTQSKRSGK